MLSLTLKVTRNTFSNLVGYAWTTGVALFLIPYTVTQLGVEGFGIWSLIFVVTTYLGLLDFGINAAIIKYVAEHHTQKNQMALNRVVTIGVLLFAGLGVILIGVAWITARPILSLFRIPPETYGDAHVVFLGAVVYLALTNLSNVFQSVLTGLQRLDWVNFVSISSSTVNVIMTVGVLEFGYGLRGLTLVRVVVAVGGLLGFAVLARRLVPTLSIVSVPRTLLNQVFGYGLRIQVTNFASVIHHQSGKLMLGYFVGVAPVTFYELGFRIANIVNSLPRLFLSALTPATAELDARARTDEQVTALYIRAARYLTLVALPIELLPFVSASLIMRIWMGPGYDAAVPALRALVLVFLVNLVLTGAGTTVARGIGRPGYETRYAVVVIGINLGLGIPLTVWLGLRGVLVAAVLASVVGSTYFLVIFHREHLNRSVVAFVSEVYLRPAIVALVAVIAALSISSIFNTVVRYGWVLESRLTILTALGVQVGVFLGLYLAGIYFSDYLDAEDRRLLKDVRHWVISESRSFVGRLATD